MTGRADLLRAIDRLADAALSGNRRRIENRRRDACALALMLVQDLTVCECGVRCASSERLSEHLHLVHGAQRPRHWQDEAID